MLRGQVGGWVGGLRGVGILAACPCSIPQNWDYHSQLLKIVINHQPSSFFIWGEFAAQLENKSSRHCFPPKMQTCHGTKCHSFHLILGRVNFTPEGKNYPRCMGSLEGKMKLAPSRAMSVCNFFGGETVTL